jgi:hypothetical protein
LFEPSLILLGCLALIAHAWFSCLNILPAEEESKIFFGQYNIFKPLMNANALIRAHSRLLLVWLPPLGCGSPTTKTLDIGRKNMQISISKGPILLAYK